MNQNILTSLNLFDKTSHTSEIVEAAYKFSEKFVAPLNSQADLENTFPEQLWQQLGSYDLLGITIPTSYGGIDAGYLAHLAVMEAISYGSGSIGLSYAAHSNLCMNQLKLNGTNAQKEKYLPKLANGKFVGALAMSEPNAGSDVMSMETKATKCDGGYILNGQKLWITNGGNADVLIVYAKTSPEMGSKGITAFLVEKEMKGFTPGSKINKIGMRGSETWELFFDNCFVPHENILGSIDKGSKVLMSGLNYERLILSGGSLGLAQAALDFTCKYTTERKQFGKSLNSNQVVAHKLAQMHSSLSAVRTHAYYAASLADSGEPISNDLAASVFFEASDKATFITQNCVTLCGGMGYTKDLPVEHFHRDQMLYEIGGGAREIRLEIISRTLLKNFEETKTEIKCNNKYTQDLTSYSKGTGSISLCQLHERDHNLYKIHL